jgi:hypothetical protein
MRIREIWFLRYASFYPPKHIYFRLTAPVVNSDYGIKLALNQSASIRHSLHKEKIKGSLGMGTWFKKKLAWPHGPQKKRRSIYELHQF